MPRTEAGAASGRWRARATTLEAIAWLALARMLVRTVRFGRWRRWLGRSVKPPAFELDGVSEANVSAHRLARAVKRAAGRLPGESRCLPQAIALLWMLRRRRLGGVLVMGVCPGARRGELIDLHAWFVRDGEVLIGAIDQPNAPVAAFEWTGADNRRPG